LVGKRVSTEAFDSDEPQTNGISQELGIDSQGHIWPSEEDALADEQESDDEDAADPRNLHSTKLFHGDTTADGYESTASSASSISRSSSSSSLASQASDASSGDSETSDPPGIAGIGSLDTSGASEANAFLKECTSSLDRSFSEGHTVDNTAIELKTLRMASNVPLKRVIGVVVPYLCDRIKVDSTASAKDVGSQVEDLVERWGSLVTSLTGGTEGGMVDALLALQTYCATQDVHPRLFAAFLQAYYNDDVISEEAALQWVRNPAARTTGGEAGTKLWQTGAAFVKALMEADSDEEESD
jgi:translation initiation factor eIF-2B subunit epsilon